MNNNLEKSRSKKIGVRKKNSHNVLPTTSVSENNIYTAERRLKDGGFIAWPENKIVNENTSTDIDIIEGRSKKGGFIAFPKFDS